MKDFGGAQVFAAFPQRQQAAGNVREQQRVDQADLVHGRFAHEPEPDAVVAQPLDEVVYAQREFDVGLAVRVLPGPEFVDRFDEVLAPCRELGDALF